MRSLADVERVAGLLRALRPGQRLTVRASGRSLWPWVVDGDRLTVERVVGAAPGDLGVIRYKAGPLIAHFVVTEAPLRTCSSMGALDPAGAELLGRVVEVRRGRVRIPLPPAARHLLRWAPVFARAARRLPFAIPLVRALRGW